MGQNENITPSDFNPLNPQATTVLLENAAPPILLEKISEHKISVLFTAPTAYRAMLALLPGKNLSSLRRCVSAGEHLPLATWNAWFEATGIKNWLPGDKYRYVIKNMKQLDDVWEYYKK